MAWVTKIVDIEQVEYRLREDSGCHVEGQQQERQEEGDGQVEYRMRPADGSVLTWIGKGLGPVGLAAGQALDEKGKRAARALMNARHPQTNARLVPPEERAHPDAKLPAAPLVAAIASRAAVLGLGSPVELFAGKPKQEKAFGALRRMVHRKGEAHRMQVGTLHRVARAAGVQLHDVYGAEELDRALAHADKRVNVRVRGYDLTADLSKSASTLWALIGPDREGEVRAVFHQALREAFEQFEKWTGYGLHGVDGQLERIETSGLLAWVVEHQSARPVDDSPGDPHLHGHIVIASMVQCADGTWRQAANGGRDFYRHASAFDALLKARFRALTAARFGVRWKRDPRTRAWEVVGIPDELRVAFSRRSAQVDGIAGVDAGRQEKIRISAETRHEKHEDQELTGIREVWRQRAQEIVGDVDAMVAAAAPGPPGPDSPSLSGPDGGPLIPPPADLAAAVFDPETGLTSSSKEFGRAQALAAVADALPYGIGDPAGLEELTDAVLAEAGYAVALPPQGSRVMSNTGRYTTTDVLAAEQVIVEQAVARFGESAARITVEQATAAVEVFELSATHPLTGEQRRLVERLLTAGHGVDAVIGPAGSGKTATMEAARIGWANAGLVVGGAALSAIAAASLQRDSGIHSRTVAWWLDRIHRGRSLHGVDVLVVDEGVMTDDRAYAVLLTAAATAGTKLVAIGDPQQLQAIGIGGGFAEVHRLVGGATLTANRRQRDPAERAALTVWRTGPDGREAALRALADHGRVHATDSPDDARAQVLAAWNAARTRWPDPHDQIAQLTVLAVRNSDVDQLNTAAQTLRRTADELGPVRTYALPGGERLRLAVGDIVRVRTNLYRSRRNPPSADMLNGYRAVVTGIDSHGTVTVEWALPGRDGGRRHEHGRIDPEEIGLGALSLGYATTVAGGQGQTVEVALMYGLGADAHALYPGITRGRAENHLWLPAAALEDEQTRAALGAPRTEEETLTRAVDAYARLMRQDNRPSMVSDQLRPQPEAVTARPVAPQPSAYAAQPPEAIEPWHRRPYGHLSDAALAQLVSESARFERWARQAVERAEELADQQEAALAADPTPGMTAAAEASAVFDQAEALATTGAEHASRASTAAAAAASARRNRDQVALDLTKSRTALALAGTSRKQLRDLHDRYASEMAAAYEAEQQERRAARRAHDAAQAVISASRHAHLLDRHPDGTLHRRLAAARADLPSFAQHLDERAAAAAGNQRREADQQRAAATRFKNTGSMVRAEQQVRRTLAEQVPDLSATEQHQRGQARAGLQVAQKLNASANAGNALTERSGLRRGPG